MSKDVPIFTGTKYTDYIPETFIKILKPTVLSFGYFICIITGSLWA